MPDNTPLVALVLAAGALLTVLWLVVTRISAARSHRDDDQAIAARKAADREAAARADDDAEDRP